MTVSRKNVADLLASKRLQFRRGPDRWVDITQNPESHSGVLHWELPFHYRDGEVMGFGAITDDWFDRRGEMQNPVLLREREDVGT